MIYLNKATLYAIAMQYFSSANNLQIVVLRAEVHKLELQKAALRAEVDVYKIRLRISHEDINSKKNLIRGLNDIIDAMKEDLDNGSSNFDPG